LNLSEILPQYSKFRQNLFFQNYDKKENIDEHSIAYLFFQQIVWGAGK